MITPSQKTSLVRRVLVASGTLALCSPFMACSSTEEVPVVTPRVERSSANSDTARSQTDEEKGQARDRIDGSPAQTAPRNLSRLAIDAGDVNWGDVKRAGARTHVLIYAATEAISKNYGLPAAYPSALALKEAFVGIGVHVDDITIRSGAEVATVAVAGGVSKLQADIRNIASGLKGEGDNLVLVWIGHGAHAENDLQLMTSDTDSDAGKLTGTLPSRDLSTCLDQAKTNAEWGNPSLGTALIIDACQTNAQGSAGGEADWNGIFEAVNVLANIEAYSAEPGEEAWVDQSTGRTAYTNALCKVIRKAQKYMDSDSIALKDLLERVRDDESLNEQRPPVPAGKGGVVLFDPNNLSLEIKVVDNVTGNVIPGAQIKFQDSQKSAPALFEGLGASREGYSMQATAPGYFARSEEVRLSRAQSGRTLEVPLAREFVVLQGHIRLPEERGVIRVAVNGSYEGLVDGYHTTSDDLQGTGFFHIKVPKFTGERKLSVKVFGETRFEETFDLATQANHNEKVSGGLIQVFDFGDTTLPPKGYGEAGLGGTGALAVDVGGVKFNFDFERLTEADFTDPGGWPLYESVNNFLKSSNKMWARAQRTLEDLKQKQYIRADKSYVLDELVKELGVAAAIHLAKEACDRDDLDLAIATLKDSDQRNDDKVRVRLFTLLMQGAGKHLQEKDFASALVLYEEAALTDADDAVNAALYAEQTRLAWMDYSVKQAYKTGDWQTPRKVVQLLTDSGAEDAALQYAEEIEKQSITRTCRLRYNSAQAAYSSGEFEEAVEFYRQALAENPNSHYRGLIRSSLEDVSGQLFKKYLTIGSEMESKEDFVGAFHAYLACCKYHPGAGESNLEFIVETHGELFRKEASSELEQAQAFLKSREIVADYDRSLAASDFGTADTILAKIEKGNVDQLELERLRRRMANAQQDFAMLAFTDYKRYNRLSKSGVQKYLELFEDAHPRLRTGLELDRIERFDDGDDGPWIAIYKQESTGVEFSLIPGGVLAMGSKGGYSNQRPVKNVSLYPFLLARHEVSSGVYDEHRKRQVGTNVLFPNRPAQGVFHNSALTWCTDLGMNLPTEAQWEWAALGARPNRKVTCMASQPQDVDSGPANPFGLLNIYDNVAEWCLDAYLDYSVEPIANSGQRLGENAAEGFVYRGGSFEFELNTGAKRRRFSKVGAPQTGFRSAINLVSNPKN